MKLYIFFLWHARVGVARRAWRGRPIEEFFLFSLLHVPFLVGVGLGFLLWEAYFSTLPYVPINKSTAPHIFHNCTCFVTLFRLSLHDCIMKNQFSFSTEDSEVDFSHLLQDNEHAGSDLFARLEKIPVYMEKDSSAVVTTRRTPVALGSRPFS